MTIETPTAMRSPFTRPLSDVPRVAPHWDGAAPGPWRRAIDEGVKAAFDAAIIEYSSEVGRPGALSLLAFGDLGASILVPGGALELAVLVAAPDAFTLQNSGGKGAVSMARFAALVIKRLDAKLGDVDWGVSIVPGAAFGAERPQFVADASALANRLAAFGGVAERLYWMGARVLAGDRALGEDALKRLGPWMIPSGFSPLYVDELESVGAMAFRDWQVVHDVETGRGALAVAIRSAQMLCGPSKTSAHAPSLRDGVAHLVTRGRWAQTEGAAVLAALAALDRAAGHPNADCSDLAPLIDRLLGTGDPDAPNAQPTFRAPELAQQRLHRLRRLPPSPWHPRFCARWPDATAQLMVEVAEGPDPDGALALMERWALSPRADVIFDAFARDPGVMQRVVRRLSLSPRLARGLASQPHGVVRLVLEGPPRLRGTDGEVALASAPDPVALKRRFSEAHWCLGWAVAADPQSGAVPLSPEHVGAELSALVTAAIRRLAVLSDAPESGLAIWALGRLARHSLALSDEIALLITVEPGHTAAARRLAQHLDALFDPNGPVPLIAAGDRGLIVSAVPAKDHKANEGNDYAGVRCLWGPSELGLPSGAAIALSTPDPSWLVPSEAAFAAALGGPPGPTSATLASLSAIGRLTDTAAAAHIATWRRGRALENHAALVRDLPSKLLARQTGPDAAAPSPPLGQRLAWRLARDPAFSACDLRAEASAVQTALADAAAALQIEPGPES